MYKNRITTLLTCLLLGATVCMTSCSGDINKEKKLADEIETLGKRLSTNLDKIMKTIDNPDKKPDEATKKAALEDMDQLIALFSDDSTKDNRKDIARRKAVERTVGDFLTLVAMLVGNKKGLAEFYGSTSVIETDDILSDFGILSFYYDLKNKYKKLKSMRTQ